MKHSWKTDRGERDILSAHPPGTDDEVYDLVRISTQCTCGTIDTLRTPFARTVIACSYCGRPLEFNEWEKQ